MTPEPEPLSDEELKIWTWPHGVGSYFRDELGDRHPTIEAKLVATIKARDERIAELEKREESWKLLVEAKDGLLAAYRVGRPPGEKTWRKLERAKKALEEPDHEDA